MGEYTLDNVVAHALRTPVQVQFVLHQVLQAAQLGLEPVAYVSRDSLDGANGYYCPSKGMPCFDRACCSESKFSQQGSECAQALTSGSTILNLSAT